MQVPARRQKPTEAARAILLAAEKTFANEGYDGASTRDIAIEAGVTLNLVTYHFGSKDRLFIACVNHRYDAWKQRVLSSLDAALADPDSTLRDLMRAYLQPFTQCASSGDAGWIHYLRLLGRGMSVYSLDAIHPTMHRLSEIPDAFMAAIGQRCRIVDHGRLAAASYLLEVALTYLVQDRGLLAKRTDGAARIDSLDDSLELMTDFYHAAFLASGGLVERRKRRPAPKPAGTPPEPPPA